MNLYLASTSPRRRQLLRWLGLRFRLLEPAPNKEPAILARSAQASPARLAQACALAKAWSVADRVSSGLIIGVDTVVAVDRRILGKPVSRVDARRMLRLLSGRTHLVASGVAVVRMPDRQALARAETTRVTFRRLGEREIRAYTATTEPYDKAGAYGIQERAGIFISRVSGCYLNVVGLPVNLLLNLLARAGFRER